MRALRHLCWFRLGFHVDKPHGNHHASRTDVLGNGITESRSYSNDNLLTAINYSNTSLGDLTYTWDTNENKTSESISGTMSGYGFTQSGTVYDDEDRLTGYARSNSSLTQSWSLTSVGDWSSVTTNGTAQSRTHGPTHELLTAGGQTVNTDVKGNITLLPTALSSLASTALGMSWDFDNKLKSVDVGNDSSTDVEYKYDALGRRVARVGSSGSNVYVQSDQQTIADYGVGDAPSSPLYRYVYASYIDEPVVRKGASETHYYHRNQQYSVTAITTSAGAIAERYVYSAYGEPTILDGSGSVIASSSINNRYSYTGREWDATVGLYHFRARWMSPKSGRFLGRDPIGFEGSQWDLYEIMDGDSLGGLDPLGMFNWWYWGGCIKNRSSQPVITSSTEVPGYPPKDWIDEVWFPGQSSADHRDIDFVWVNGEWWKMPQRWLGSACVVINPDGTVVIETCNVVTVAGEGFGIRNGCSEKRICTQVPLEKRPGIPPEKTPHNGGPPEWIPPSLR